MPIQLSSGALAQLVAKDIKTDVAFKLYDVSDVYVCDLDVTNYSYSKSRDFNVGVMNLTLANVGGQYDVSGTTPITKDCIILALEGYVVSGVSELYPTFKGRVRNITSVNQAGIRNITVDVYDEAMILQTSDVDAVYEANKVAVTQEVLLPVYYDALDIDAVDANTIKIIYTKDSQVVPLIVEGGEITISASKYTLGTIISKPNAQLVTNVGHIYYTDLVGMVSIGDTIVNAGRTFSATVVGGSVAGRLDVNPANGAYVHGETLYVLGDEANTYFTAKNLWYIASPAGYAGQFSGVTTASRVYNGFIDTFTSAHNNWAEDELITIKVKYKGIFNSPDLDIDFDLQSKAGTIKLAYPINMVQYDVYASYYYYSDAYYVEDIVTEILTTPDPLVINTIYNGDFKQGATGWDMYTAGGLSTYKYALAYNQYNGVTIDVLQTNFAANEQIGLSVENAVDMVAGVQYTFTLNVSKTGAIGGKIYLSIPEISYAVSTTVNNIQTLTYTVTPSVSAEAYPMWYLSGIKANQSWTINAVALNYIPTKTTTLASSNIYCNYTTECGSATTITLTPNLNYRAIPLNSILTQPINNLSVKIYLRDTTGFSTAGFIKVDDEIIQYNNITATSLDIIGRGVNSTLPVDHDTGKRVYETRPPYQVWTLPYNNIIPKSVNTTASTFDAVNGVNIGSAGSFTITGSTFESFFYREGLLITNANASAVVLTSNINYRFNQVQTTNIQTPYVVFDYKKVSTRFDAINILRKLVAPNYVINTAIRQSGSTYRTYIQGRYLSQKLTADYDLYNLTNLTFNSDETTYNRVKVFGKLANPYNLMWDQRTTVQAGDDYQAMYVNNVSLKYLGQNLNKSYYYYQPNIKNTVILPEPRIPNIRVDSTNLSDYRILISSLDRTYSNTPRLLGYISRVASNSTEQPPLVCGLVRGTMVNWSYAYYFCNVYYLKYTGAARFTNTSVITGIQRIFNVTNFTTAQLQINDGAYDGSIMLHHGVADSIFIDGQVITDGTAIATVTLPSIRSIKTQVNYYAVLNDRTLIPTDVLTSILGLGSEPNIGPNRLYIDGHANDESLRYEQVTAEWDRITIIDGGKLIVGQTNMGHVMHRNYENEDPYIYINETEQEYLNNKKYGLSVDNDNYLGTLSFYKGAELWRTINSVEGDVFNPPYAPNVGIPYFLFSDYYNFTLQILNITKGGKPFGWIENGPFDNYTPVNRNDKNDIRSTMYNATRLKYFRKYNNGVNWILVNSTTIGDTTYRGVIRIPKVDFDTRKLDPKQVNLTIDCNLAYNNADNSYINSNIKPTLYRLRILTDTRAEEQCSVISADPIIDYTLFNVDFGTVRNIGYIDIQAGYCYLKPISNVGDTKYDAKFKLDIYYSDEDVPAEYVSQWRSKSQMVDIAMSTGEVKSLTSSDIGEYFSARHLKFKVNTDEIAIERTTPEGEDTYCATIAGLAVYESDILKGEAYRYADVINLYKDTNIYEALHTQDLVDNYADALLIEFSKNQTKANAGVIWAPHLEMGQTVHVLDNDSGTDRNYFIEGISNNNGKLSVDMAYYE